MKQKPDCLCYDCVADLTKRKKKDPDAYIDCACEGAADVYKKDRCDMCDVRNACDIFLHPENYQEE